MSSDTKWYGDKAKQAAQSGGADGVLAAAEALLKRTLPKVPKLSGDLADSGRVEVEGTQAAVIFDADHAVRQHEDTTLRHHDGGEAKFLESTLKDDQQALLELLADALKKAFAEGGD